MPTFSINQLAIHPQNYIPKLLPQATDEAQQRVLPRKYPTYQSLVTIVFPAKTKTLPNSREILNRVKQSALLLNY